MHQGGQTMKAGDCINRDILLCSQPWRTDEIRSQAQGSGCRYVLLMSGDRVGAVVPSWQLPAASRRPTGNGDEFPAALTEFGQFQAGDPISLLAESEYDLAVVVDASGRPVGIVDPVRLLAAAWRHGKAESRQIMAEYQEYKDIIQHIEEEIFLVDGELTTGHFCPQGLSCDENFVPAADGSGSNFTS